LELIEGADGVEAKRSGDTEREGMYVGIEIDLSDQKPRLSCIHLKVEVDVKQHRSNGHSLSPLPSLSLPSPSPLLPSSSQKRRTTQQRRTIKWKRASVFYLGKKMVIKINVGNLHTTRYTQAY